MNKILGILLMATALGSTQCRGTPDHAPLSPTLVAELAKNRAVFIVPAQTAVPRKAPRETWFLHQDGAIYITSPADDPRTLSIKSGSPDATIAIGKPKGLALKATGAIVNDAKVSKSVLDNLASKYPEFWKDFGDLLQQSVSSGASVVIKYTPTGS